MRTQILALAGVTAAAIAAGQADAPWRSARTVSRDTTFVRTVIYDTVMAELSLVRSGQIGADSGASEPLLATVTATTATPDGGVILFDGGKREVRWFDSTLGSVRTVARQGSAPGEIPPKSPFNPTPGVVVEDNTIWQIAIDNQRRVVALFDVGPNRGALVYDALGGFEGTWRFPRATGTFPHEATLAPDNLLHVRQQLPSPSGTCYGPLGEPICREIAIRYRLDGRVVDTIRAPAQRWNVATFYYTVNVGTAKAPLRQRRFMRTPFAPYPLRAYNAHGFWMTARPDTYQIVLHRPGGPIVIKSDNRLVRTTPEERRSAFERFAQPFMANKPASKISIADIPLTKPNMREIRSDAEGRIWVLLHVNAMRSPAQSTSGQGGRLFEPAVFDVFAPTGEFLGRVRIPIGATFKSAAGRFLWTRESDSLGVQRLVRYTISASTPRSPSAAYWAPK